MENPPKFRDFYSKGLPQAYQFHAHSPLARMSHVTDSFSKAERSLRET